MAFFKKSLGMVNNLILVKLFAAVEPGFPLTIGVYPKTIPEAQCLQWPRIHQIR
jgi:hypothetical protein